MATENKAYWAGQGVLVIGDTEVRFGDEIPAIKGFDVVPFLKSGKASHTKPAIESEVVKGLEERFIALRAENERLVAELAEALARPSGGEEVEALRAELGKAAFAHDEIGAALEDARKELGEVAHAHESVKQELNDTIVMLGGVRQELDDAKAMITALTPQVGATPEPPVIPAIPGAHAGPKAGK